MPEKRLTIQILTPEEGYNDPVQVNLLGAQTLGSFQGKEPRGPYQGESVEACLATLGAELDAAIAEKASA